MIKRNYGEYKNNGKVQARLNALTRKMKKMGVYDKLVTADVLDEHLVLFSFARNYTPNERKQLMNAGLQAVGYRQNNKYINVHSKNDVTVGVVKFDNGQFVMFDTCNSYGTTCELDDYWRLGYDCY